MAVTKTKKNETYHNANMAKSFILDEIRKRGFRVTSQRELIIDIILKNKCSCSKEIYYEASMLDQTIGIATVYRMLRLLEEIGAIDRSSVYQLNPKAIDCMGAEKAIFMKDDNEIEYLEENVISYIKECLKKRGLIHDEDISVVVKAKKACQREGACCD